MQPATETPDLAAALRSHFGFDALRPGQWEALAPVLAGRDAVGATVGLPKRHAPSSSTQPKDDLDSLIDALDNF